MYVKQKVMKEREAREGRGRYGAGGNCDSTPTLLKAKELIHCNKENNLNHHNHQQPRLLNKSNEFEVLTSLELPKRLKTAADEEEQLQFRAKNKRQQEEVRSSQEIFRFKQKQPERLGYDSVNFGEHMTFGSVSQRRQGMMTSREFQEEKKLKNEVIEEIITNAKRGLCKSFNEFSLGVAGNCVNHPDKKVRLPPLRPSTDSSPNSARASRRCSTAPGAPSTSCSRASASRRCASTTPRPKSARPDSSRSPSSNCG